MSSGRGRTAIKRAIFALAAALIFLGGLEIILVLAGYAPNPDRERSLANNQAPRDPVWVSDRLHDGGPTFYLSAIDQHPRPFPALKQPHSFRVAVLGGSAAHGYGMTENGAFSHRLQQLLEPAYPNRSIEVLNFGTIGWASQQHVWLVKRVLEGVSPDLIVAFAGNNELLEVANVRRYLDPARFDRWIASVQIERQLSRSRLFLGLRALVRAVRNDDTVDTTHLENFEQLPETKAKRLGPRERRYAADTFRHNFSRVLELAEARGVGVMFVTLPVNLRVPPHSYPPPEAISGQFQALMERGERLESEFRNREAARAYLEAGELYECAEVHWRLGRIFEGQTDQEATRREYLLAKDTSQHPNRVLSEVSEATRDLAREHDAALVDGERLFYKVAPDGLPGYDLIFDYCHPSVVGHWYLAREIAREVVKQGYLGPPAGPADFESVVDDRLSEFERQRIDSLRVDEWLGIELDPRPGYHQDSRPPLQEVYRRARVTATSGTAADCIYWGDASFHTSQWVGNQHLGGSLDEALEAWSRALEIDPTLCVAYANMGYLFASIGWWSRAADAYVEAARCEPLEHEWTWRATRAAGFADLAWQGQ